MADDSISYELVVAQDGSIPAEQLRDLGLSPGVHLRVVETIQDLSSSPLDGSLVGFPDLSWEDFKRASELARRDNAV